MILLIITIIFIIVIRVIVTTYNLKKRQRQLDSVLKNTDNFSASFTVKDLESKLDMVDREEKARLADTSVNKPTASFSNTDEIEILYSLKERGIISEEEFVKLKKKLL